MWLDILRKLFPRTPAEQIAKSAVQPKIGIQGSVIAGCRHCGAPGVWKATTDPDWQHCSGILLPTGHERIGQFVGRTCPHCGYARPLPERPVLLWKAKRGWLLG